MFVGLQETDDLVDAVAESEPVSKGFKSYLCHYFNMEDHFEFDNDQQEEKE